MDAIERGLDVRIIIGLFKDKWLKSRDRRGIILTELSQKIPVKLKEDYHGRVMIIDDILLIGSVDLDNQGLRVHDNVPLQTNDLTSVEKAKEIFHQLEANARIIDIGKT